MKEALAQLPGLLESHGLFQRYLAFGDGNLRFWDWAHVAEQMTGDAQGLWKFFLCHGTLGKRDGERLMGEDALQALVQHGVCTRSRRGYSLGRHALLTYHRRPFFVALQSDSRSLFTEDTKALISTIPGRNFESCLSIYSGCGAECLLLEPKARQNLTFLWPEADPGVIRANLALNHCATSPRFTSPSGLKASERFDLILARVPCWSLPESLAPFMDRPGGADGLAEFARCLQLVARRLREGGTFAFTGLLYGEDRVQAPWEKLHDLAAGTGLTITATCSSKQNLDPGIPLFNSLLGFLQYKSGRPVRSVLKDLIDHFCDRRMSHVYFIKGMARLTGAVNGHSLIDLSERYYGNWSI